MESAEGRNARLKRQAMALPRYQGCVARLEYLRDLSRHTVDKRCHASSCCRGYGNDPIGVQLTNPSGADTAHEVDLVCDDYGVAINKRSHQLSFFGLRDIEHDQSEIGG